MTFWIVISKPQDVGVPPSPCTVTLFDRQPAAGVRLVHRLTGPSHWPLTLQARRQVDAGQDVGQTYGNALARWLFCDQADPGRFNPIGERLREVSSGSDESQRLRLFVCVEPSLLMTPEFQQSGFLQALSANTLLPLEAVRFVAGEPAEGNTSNGNAKPPVADQLRVLVVLSNPDERSENTAAGFEHLPSLEEDFTALIASLAPLQQHQAIFLEVLRQPSGAMLEARLQHVNPHVFVFLGHGYHDAGGSGLVCVEQGMARRWAYDRLQQALGDITGGADLRLVVLVACRSFIAAPELLFRGIPAVVGMQKYGSRDFPSAGVAPFAVPFFTAVSDFSPVAAAFAKGVEGLQTMAWQDEALKAARQMAHSYGDSGKRWVEEQQRYFKAAAVMPTLWLASPEDRLFAESESRLRKSYQNALNSKIARCEWSGQSGNVPLMEVFTPPPVCHTHTAQSVDLDTILSPSAAILVQGVEWSGKTTLAHWVALSRFHRDHQIPVLVNLREMDQQRQSLEQWVAGACRRWLGLHSFEQAAHLIREECRQGLATLVIDDVEPQWLEQPPSALRIRLFGEQGVGNQSPILVTAKTGARACHPDWTCLTIDGLSMEQQHRLAKSYGQALDLMPATRDFLQRFTNAAERPNGVTVLAGRSGFLAEMLAQFLRRMVMLTDESDLLETLQQIRWRKPVESAQMIHPDEPVYKQQMLEALGFHTYFCRPKGVRGPETQPIMQMMLKSMLRQLDFGEGPVYAPDLAPRLLQEHVAIRPFLQRSEAGDWAFRSEEWTRFYAASQLAALVNDQDPAVLAWIEHGKSLQCRSCGTNLGTFRDRVIPEWVDRVVAGLAVVRAEDLPAWRRTDPWDCPAVREFRRVLVRALPLNPLASLPTK